jgi:hypothetical protein
MTTMREPDEILAAWLDAGPRDLPGQTRRAILTALPTTPQARRGRLAPAKLFWRSGTARLAVVAIAAVIAAGGLLSLLGPSRQAPGASPTPSQTVGPAATAAVEASPNLLDTATWTPFTSTLNGFSARFPSDWTVTAATTAGDLASMSDAHRALSGPWAVFDEAVAPAGPRRISGVSTKLPSGMTADQWLAAYRQPIIDRSAGSCFPTRDKWQAVTVDGQTNGGLYHGCEWYAFPNEIPDNYTLNYIEVILFVDGRAYVFQLNLGRHVDNGEARQLLDAFLTTVRFDPANAQNP